MKYIIIICLFCFLFIGCCNQNEQEQPFKFEKYEVVETVLGSVKGQIIDRYTFFK